MGVRNVLEGALARLNKEHLTTTESSNIAAETSHGEDPGDSSFEQIEGTNSKGVEEHLTKTESSNIAAETSHGEDPGDISLAEIDKRNATLTQDLITNIKTDKTTVAKFLDSSLDN